MRIGKDNENPEKKVLFLPVILEYFAVFGTFGYFVYLILSRMDKNVIEMKND